ncbi:MAG: N-acetylneuraminate synthase family protein [Phycisphaerales bacterium]|nr:N-acetylneuraminate synthase family protein [Phycisphaerales bacterium]
MRIGTRDISAGHPPYIIAELGVNHDGSGEKAIELARAAIDSGVDAIKLQYFEAERLMSKASRLAGYQEAAGETDPVAMLRRLELSIDQMAPVVALAKERGVHAIVTVFSVELVARARELGWDAYKTASPDIINRPLLMELAGTERPMIVSTGASTLPEVGRALKWLKDLRERVAVMQCVSSYPTGMQESELGGIAAIADIFPGVVGYSDHTREAHTGALAVTCGACILEKHFTLDKKAPGPDHAASLEPAEMGGYVQMVRAAFGELEAHRRYGTPTSFSRSYGPGIKRVLEIERDVRRVSRQSLVAVRDLAAGHVISREDLTIKRPGMGIEPWKIDEVVGKTLAVAVGADEMVMAGAVG